MSANDENATAVKAPIKRDWSRKPRKVGVVFDRGRVEIFRSINAAARYIDVAPESLQQALDEQRSCYSMEVFYVYREPNDAPEPKTNRHGWVD